MFYDTDSFRIGRFAGRPGRPDTRARRPPRRPPSCDL